MGSIVLIVTGTVQIITLLLFTVTLTFRNTGKIQKTFAEIRSIVYDITKNKKKKGGSHSEVLPETLSSWKQINLTRTKRGAVRGLHGEAMAKLVTVATGSVFGVYVDTRPDSKTFGAVETVHITPGIQVFVPQGVCNGFQALEEGTEYLYFFDNEWAPGMSGTALTPLDNELGIEWPIPIEKDNREQLSEKDAKAPTLRELKEILKCE